MASLPSTLVLLSTLLPLLFFPSPSAANEGNIIVTGDVLYTDSQLTSPNSVLVMQNDCNLVLYNPKGFQSGTSGFGPNCTAGLTEYGQLQVKNSLGTVIWTSDSSGPKGNYAGILQPDGRFGIYGPALWAIPRFNKLSAESSAEEQNKIDNQPNVPNLLFSSEILNENSTLVSRDYTFGVKQGCVLEFTKAAVGVTWSSPAGRYGSSSRHCYARLNFLGQLSILDDNNRVVWQTKPALAEGVYVLVVKITGEVAIYGTRIWLI
ncbi:mannose-specific lectin 1-like [Phalaenopsis equestris]|uniref:mannose-specific lectin 1-like n=1 Tax=Phalaenopsis equestris TaxID=78828 RepID=UPI0009E1CF2A|nr:mannose-specific lectin 1-like [Phalaenopsis equestris]